MTTAGKLLVLDFDGVICDSVGECCIVACRMLARMFPEDNRAMPQTLTDVEPDMRDHFFAHRLLIGPGADFETVVEMYRRGVAAHTAEELQQFVQEYHRERPRDSNAFYEERNIYRNKDMAGWLSLHTLYAGIPQKIAALQEQLPVFIVSNKDQLSVKLILEQQGVVFPDEKIYGREVGLNKFPTIQKIAEDQGLEMSDLFFVEDHLPHLAKPFEAGVTCFLADWGYTTDGDRAQAREMGIRVLELGEFGVGMVEE